jgi:hypothetical protein
MDATITERMTRAKEKDERSLERFNQLVERRGSNVRIWSRQMDFIHVDSDSAIVQETPTLPNANVRIRMVQTDRQVHPKAQVREGSLLLLILYLISITRSHVHIPLLLLPCLGHLTHLPCPR